MPSSAHFTALCRHPLPRQAVEAGIADLAARQHGVVSRRQLLEAGISPDAVDRRIGSRRLVPMHRGVYRVGPLVAPLSAEMAACLVCGGPAVLSHRSAARVWGLLPRAACPPPPEVTVRRRRRPRPDVRIHRSGTLRPGETTKFEGIPITTPERTLYDLAASAGQRELERAVAEAFARRLTDPTRVRELVSRHAGRPGSRALRAAVEGEGPAFTRSEAEERFLALTQRGRLDHPEVNVEAEGFEVDFLWRPAGLVVEIDGFAFHRSRRAFERDRRRDAVLVAAGFRVVRLTWRQIRDEPEAVLVRLAQALSRGR